MMMNSIGGNIIAQLQIHSETDKNKIGECVKEWSTIQNIRGFLDLSNGDARYTNYNAKVQESSHLFISNFVDIDTTISNYRMIINGKVYDVKYIDNPMNLNEHLEFYLSFVG